MKVNFIACGKEVVGDHHSPSFSLCCPFLTPLNSNCLDAVCFPLIKVNVFKITSSGVFRISCSIACSPDIVDILGQGRPRNEVDG